MPRNNSGQLHIDQRRRQVAAMRLRHMTQREIADALPRAGIVNPKTGQPYDLAQVNRDLKALKEEWRQGAQEDLATMRGEHHAEILEARRKAWADGKLYYVFEGLRQEADLLGLKMVPEQDWTAATGSFLAGVQAGAAQAEDMSERAVEP
jgi:hypothetical protein